jgi:hypothetical protein
MAYYNAVLRMSVHHVNEESDLPDQGFPFLNGVLTFEGTPVL